MALADHGDAFYVDGSLRDLYVLDTTLEHWQRMLDYVRRAGLAAGFTRGTSPSPLPQHAADIFAELDDPDHESLLLRLNVGGLQINCYFFQDDEIEFDLDPREVTDEQRYEALMGFMVGLGRATGRRVVMTPESASGATPSFVPLFDCRLAPTSLRTSPLDRYGSGGACSDLALRSANAPGARDLPATWHPSRRDRRTVEPAGSP